SPGPPLHAGARRPVARHRPGRRRGAEPLPGVLPDGDRRLRGRAGARAPDRGGGARRALPARIPADARRRDRRARAPRPATARRPAPQPPGPCKPPTPRPAPTWTAAASTPPSTPWWTTPWPNRPPAAALPSASPPTRNPPAQTAARSRLSLPTPAAASPPS